MDPEIKLNRGLQDSERPKTGDLKLTLRSRDLLVPVQYQKSNYTEGMSAEDRRRLPAVFVKPR